LKVGLLPRLIDETYETKLFSYDVINYNDVISATNPSMLVENVLFTDIEIVKKFKSNINTLILITY